MKNYTIIAIIIVFVISGYFVYQIISETPTPDIQPEAQIQPDDTNCAEKGEYINYPSGTSKNMPDECCAKLKGLHSYRIENDKCEVLIGGPFLTCMPCGNGICETVNNFEENKCNCPEDCQFENLTDSDENKVYTVKELLASGLPKGQYVKVRGIMGPYIMLRVGEDYEGPGSGCLLTSSDYNEMDKGYSIHIGSGKELLKYNEKEIIVSGLVRYCGGNKIPEYICGLTNVEFIDSIEETVSEVELITLDAYNWEALGSTIVIEKDGAYTVEFGRPGIKETREGKLTTDELTQIINNANIFSMNDKYTGPRKTTRSWMQYNLIIETKSGSKTVNFHSEDETAPQVLHDIVDKIIQLTK